MTPSSLARFPASFLAIPYGLIGLAGAWHRAIPFDWPFVRQLSAGLLWAGCGIWLLFVLLYAAKCLRFPQAVLVEYRHPVQGALLALLPLSTMLVAANLGGPDQIGWLILVLFALALQGLIAVRVVSLLATGQMPADSVTPALYLPSVAGGFIGGLTLASLGYPGWAGLLFGMGLAGWGLLEIRVLSRLFEGPMPEPLRATIGVELAPAPIATLAAAVIWPQLSGELLIIGLGIAAGPIVAVLVRYRWWCNIPFSPAFWSFCFPLAALAAVVVEVVHRGQWPPLVAGIALFAVSALTLWLVVRTVALILRGKFLPRAG